MSTSALQVRGLVKHFGGVRALDGVEDVKPLIRPYDGKNWQKARADLG